MIARPSPRGVVVRVQTDFSDPSLPALEAAVSEAPGAGVHNSSSFTSSSVGVFALAACGRGGLPFLPAAPTISLPAIDDLMNAAQGRLGEALARFAIDGEAIVRSGPAAQTIVDLAASSGAELVVVGTHGRIGLSRLTLGSTAESVIRSATCSVLVVRLYSMTTLSTGFPRV